MFYESRWVRDLNQCVDRSLRNGTQSVGWSVSTCPEKHLCLRATTFKCISFRDTQSFVVSCVSDHGVHINHHSTLWARGSAGGGSLLIGSLWQRRKSRWGTQIWSDWKAESDILLLLYNSFSLPEHTFKIWLCVFFGCFSAFVSYSCSDIIQCTVNHKPQRCITLSRKSRQFVTFMFKEWISFCSEKILLRYFLNSMCLSCSH